MRNAGSLRSAAACYASSTSPPKAFPSLEGAQRQASDPLVHAALSASAGHRQDPCADRARPSPAARAGSTPSSILCLTFTKAGAAEMANRIGERLAHWVRLPTMSASVTICSRSARIMTRIARNARDACLRDVLDAPGGGLRIQTIHGFAQTLLASFPAEAGISPGFRADRGARRSRAGARERWRRCSRTPRRAATERSSPMFPRSASGSGRAAPRTI